MGLLGIGIFLIFATVIGIGIGISGVKLFQWILKKRITSGAVKLLKGERENKCDIDGKIIEVSRFIVRDEKDREILIDLKKGIAIIPKEPPKEIEKPPEFIKDKEDTKKSKKKVSTKNKKDRKKSKK